MPGKKSSIQNNNVRNTFVVYKNVIITIITHRNSYWGGQESTVINCSPLFKIMFEADVSSKNLHSFIHGIGPLDINSTFYFGKLNKQQKKPFDQIIQFFRAHPILLKIQQESVRTFWKHIRPIVPLIEKICLFGYGPIPQQIRKQAEQLLNSLSPDENFLYEKLEKIDGKVGYDLLPLLKRLFEKIRPGDFDYLQKDSYKSYIDEKKYATDPYQQAPKLTTKYSESKLQQLKQRVPIKQCKSYSQQSKSKKKMDYEEKLKFLKSRVEFLLKILEPQVVQEVVEEKREESLLQTRQSQVTGSLQMLMNKPHYQNQNRIQQNTQPQHVDRNQQAPSHELTQQQSINNPIDQDNQDSINLNTHLSQINQYLHNQCMDVEFFLDPKSFCQPRSDSLFLEPITNNLTHYGNHRPFEYRNRQKDEHDSLLYPPQNIKLNDQQSYQPSQQYWNKTYECQQEDFLFQQSDSLF